MAKCIRCGKSTVVRGHVKLADAPICTPCFRSLGFKLNETATASIYKYDDIKDGKDAYYQKAIERRAQAYDQDQADRLGLKLSEYLAFSELDCSDQEMKVLRRINALLEDEDCNPDRIDYEREPGAPLSAFLGDELLYELKYTPDIKWLRIGSDGDKKRITGPAGINKLADKLSEKFNSLL